MKKLFEITDKIAINWLTIYFFLLIIFIIFRADFLFFLRDYLNENTTFYEIILSQYKGALLSMTSAGYLSLFLFIPTVFSIVFTHKYFITLKKLCAVILFFILSILHIASIPFYETYRENFNQMIFRGINEDWRALLVTFYEQFSLIPRLILTVILTIILYKIFIFFIKKEYLSKLFSFFPKIISRSVLIIFCYLTILWTLFGGALSWEHQVDFENSGVMRDKFLNEAILDSPQAIYRAYRHNSRVLSCNGLDFTAADVKRLAAIYANTDEYSDNIDDYLTKYASGEKIKEPRHIFVILAESYAAWPLLKEYENLHIADGVKEIMQSEDADYTLTMLPNGSSTVSALMGITTGFADANLYLTVMQEAYKEPYSTAIAPVMKRLGYKTNFYYAGPSTWENIGAFTKAQGFDEFISKGDFKNSEGSVWGVKDEILFDEVFNDLTDEKTFNVILTASNHSPFNLDLNAENIDTVSIKNALVGDAKKDEWLVKELGHFKYADREIAKFISKTKEKYSDSVFIIIGDHADRYNIEKNATDYKRYAIPFIISGKGVKKGLLDNKSAGSHIDVMPTLVEIIAPKDFKYCSLGKSLTENQKAVNYGFFMTRNFFGNADKIPLEFEKISDENDILNEEEMVNYINSVRAVSWYRAKYGNIIDENLIKD